MKGQKGEESRQMTKIRESRFSVREFRRVFKIRNLRLNAGKKRLIMIRGKSFAAQMEVEMNDKKMGGGECFKAFGRLFH